MTDIVEGNKVATKLSVAELANVPIEFKLGELTLELRQLKLSEIFGHFEQKIRAKKLKEAQEMSDLITDGKNKNEFLISVWKSLPTGTELTDMITDIMQSIDGISDIISLSSGASISEIQEQIQLDKFSELLPMVSWIIGVNQEDVNLNEDGSDGSDDSEKKTEKTEKTEKMM